MQDIPECLSRRYKALDELVKELNELGPVSAECKNDPGIKLLCDFWNILKEDPNVNLCQAVQQRMAVKSKCSDLSQTNQRKSQFSCYMADCRKRDEEQEPETINKTKNQCCKASTESARNAKCRAMKTLSTHSADTPLNKVLCNLKDAASFEKKCQTKINALLDTQKKLQEQIQTLEQKEKEGVQLLKQADCLWTCMEEAYKKKLAESLERQKDLLTQLKEVEESNSKWRRNKKDLDFEMDKVHKCHQEITEKINQKSNDVKCIDNEIDNFKRHIESTKKELESTKISMANKKRISDGKLANIAKEVSRLEKLLQDELQYQKIKEQESSVFVKEARDDLQKLCKVLLQKRIENEDMNTERETLILDIELLKQTADQCKDKCRNKEAEVDNGIKAIDKEIDEFKLKCIRCHECADTADIRKYCTDCPRCINERDCLLKGDHCSPDHSMNCVCTTVKRNFLDNIFDNMYTTLERQIKMGPGKAVAEAVLNCLKRSRNGKLDTETRKILQDFILSTVKKNLNLTIVGGAIKTRCEMDSDTYKELMLCLKQVKVVKPEKIDIGTDSMKEPCTRWGGISECNCPKGPKECICTKKAPMFLDDPTSWPPDVEDKETKDKGEKIVCLNRGTTSYGPDCVQSDVLSEVASWRPDPCQGPTCQFRNMRAAQCVLGPELIPSYTTAKTIQTESLCQCCQSSTSSCICKENDLKSRPRDRIIEEVIDNLLKSNNLLCNNNVCPNTSIRQKKQKPVKQILHKNMEKTDKIINEDYNFKNKNILDRTKQKGKNIKEDFDAIKGVNKFTQSIDSHIDAAPSKCKILSNRSRLENEGLQPIQEKYDDNKVFKEQIIDMEYRKMYKGPEKINQQNEEKCKKYRHPTKCKIYKLKVQGIDIDKEPMFIVKKTNSGNYSLVLDKEFGKYHKKTIREHEGDEIVQYAKLIRTSSGYFILNFDKDYGKSNENDKALVVKSESGNIKVLLDESNDSRHSTISSKSIMTAQDISHLLRTYSSANCSKPVNQEKYYGSQLFPVKSSSDSNMYVKENINNQKILLTKSSELKGLLSKATATSCNNKNEESCNTEKCVCKNIYYKSKQWFWKNTDSLYLTSSSCGVNINDLEKLSENDTNNVNELKNENIIISNDGGSHTYFDHCKDTIDKSCEDQSNELDKSFYNATKEDALMPIKIIPKESPLKELIPVIKDEPTPLQWDTIDYLPPQLPPFLKEFEYM